MNGLLSVSVFFFGGVNGLLTFTEHVQPIMPTVAILPSRLRVMLHRRDHDPPHFRAERAGREVQIVIADISVLRGSLEPSDMAVLCRWALAHQAELALNWVLARAMLPLREIPYP